MIININIGKVVLFAVVFGAWIALAELIAYGVKVLVLGLLAKIRKRKRDRRIIRHAKETGAWDVLDVLGGRALELRAWQQYGIKRKPGETDACLRLRIEEMIDEKARRRNMCSGKNALR